MTSRVLSLGQERKECFVLRIDVGKIQKDRDGAFVGFQDGIHLITSSDI